jgi:hypothetical protein
MGCNCKRGKGKLNNLNSKDHLKLAVDFYETTISKKPIQEYDEFDKIEASAIFNQLYPNASIKDNMDLIVSEITFAAQKYKTLK